MISYNVSGSFIFDLFSSHDWLGLMEMLCINWMVKCEIYKYRSLSVIKSLLAVVVLMMIIYLLASKLYHYDFSSIKGMKGTPAIACIVQMNVPLHPFILSSTSSLSSPQVSLLVSLVHSLVGLSYSFIESYLFCGVVMRYSSMPALCGCSFLHLSSIGDSSRLP